MCGGTVKEIQKSTDKAIKDTQKAADSVINQAKNVIDQNTDTLTQGGGILSMPDLTKIGPIDLSGGGKGAPSYSVPSIDLSSLQPNLDQDLAAPVNQALQDINVPKPNTEQLNLSPNLDQDLKAPVDEAIQAINVPRPNTDQDLTKVSVQGLQESLVKQAGDAQDSLIQTGTDIQAGLVDIGKTGQEALVQAGKTGQEALVQAGKVTQEAAVQAGKAVQEQAVQTATQVSGGQKNETLEAVANNATKTTENVISTATKGTELGTSVLTNAVETQVQQATKYVEEKVVPAAATFIGDITGYNPVTQILTDAGKQFEKITPNIELLGSMDLAGGGSVKDTSDPMDSGANLDAKDFGGNDDPFGNIETSTTKADKLTEEERLRRIRRLMLNRYGREDTILTGAKDPFNRRRYARAL